MAVKKSVTKKYSLFAYKKGDSFVHKFPAWAKILIIPILSILTFYLPIFVSAVLIVLQFILAFYLKFSIREQAQDFKPVIFYAIMLFWVKIFMWLGSAGKVSISLDFETVEHLVKIFALMQMASIVFKTSTSLELREGIGKIETFIRKIFHLKAENQLTDTLSMFVNFLPMVSKNWEQSKRAWIARQGKKSLKMYLTLIPVLFSVGMKQAYNTARALTARKS